MLCLSPVFGLWRLCIGDPTFAVISYIRDCSLELVEVRRFLVFHLAEVAFVDKAS